MWSTNPSPQISAFWPRSEPHYQRIFFAAGSNLRHADRVSQADNFARDPKSPLKRGAIALVLGALFLSGVASIVNQVVWQRALKIFLGGSESISAMVVVLVFMLGLGLGAPVLPGRYLLTDDHPLLEYPDAAARLVNLR